MWIFICVMVVYILLHVHTITPSGTLFLIIERVQNHIIICLKLAMSMRAINHVHVRTAQDRPYGICAAKCSQLDVRQAPGYGNK